MARHGNLEARMRSLFDADVIRSHAPLGRRLSVALLLLITVITTGVSAVKLAAQSRVMPVPQVQVADDSRLSDGFFRDKELNEAVEERVHQDRRPGPFTYSVTVVNDDGEPVSGAKVTPTAVGNEEG